LAEAGGARFRAELVDGLADGGELDPAKEEFDDFLVGLFALAVGAVLLDLEAGGFVVATAEFAEGAEV
jgi:hypothetical protein